MPQIAGTVVLAAGQKITNQLVGEVFATLDGPSVLNVAAVNFAGTGAALGVVTMKFQVGGRIVVDNFPLKFKAGGIDADQDFLSAGGGTLGEQLTMALENTDAVNAQSVQFLVDVAPAG